MKIFPAIDLRDGKVVRLLKGDYDQMTVYGDDPLTTARGFADCGAEYIHIVDLDGAKDGGTPNMDVIKAIVEGTDLKVEVGGGIRSEEVIAAYRDAGVWRVIIGTAAVERPEWTAEMIGKYGRAIAVGADVADGRIAVRGWKEVTDVTLDQLMADLSRLGASGVICTDIAKDGAMDNDSVEDFITGYRQGAEYADSHIKVLTNFIGNFSNTAKAGECALQLNNKGADVVFQIAGAAGTGVFDAAKQYGFYAIGVDTDQKSIDPSHIICSVTKDIGQSIYDIVGDYCKDGTWEGGKTVDFDMKSGYISISYGTDEMEQQVSESLKNDVLDLQKKIEDGDIVVDSAI